MQKRNTEKKQKGGKKLLAAVSILFYAGMLLLTLGARSLHESRLPKVTVTSPEMKAFRVENYETFSPALPQELADSGRIFVISEEIINGEPRQIARLVSDLETGGLSSDGYRELKNGPSTLTKVIVDGREELSGGEEVLIEGEWKYEKD